MQMQALQVRELVRRPVLAYAAKLMLAHLIGGVVVFLLVLEVLPLPTGVTPLRLDRANAVVFFIFMPIAAVMLLGGGLIAGRPILAWTARGGPPTPRERRATLRQPMRQLAVQVATWAVGLVVFLATNLQGGTQLVTLVTVTITMGATTACAIAYVMGERELRGLVALAAASDPGATWRTSGVKTRVMVIWALSSAMPVFGIVLLAFPDAVGLSDRQTGSIGSAVFALGVLAIAVGGVGMLYVVRSIADPVRQVSDAMREVENGSTHARVSVYDGSEIGKLQAGFNRMVAGLAERELVRDLLNKHVGEDVARHAVEQGTALGGEIDDVAVLFTDIIGSTGLATVHHPDEVVGMLNEFFRVAVDVVDRNGGFINKFEGDAALAIFGTPEHLGDPAGAALRAARELRTEIMRLGIADAGIGVSSGPVVAGYVGASNRYEYTVIGDPVNEAARLTDLAKKRPGRVLASQRTIDAAGPSEQSHWRLRERVLLRGRGARTRLATPRRSSYPPDLVGLQVR
ncbi:adenylate/guanylate cyclase domain-containing protein [Tomitella gaofuii]|uniref:adenylate/guanylate cyclase domain-containing protein n=1 Tax=Tomitella gaofuii TaxID=2760083 RepID=UPI0015FC21C7|nr:adenylate/guanylate cyclase domain-containing protein [Tomitella gaofuii]